MTPDEIFQAWAPVQGVWSDWAKPVLFAHMPPKWSLETIATVGVSMELPELHFQNPCVIVVDLPGEAAVVAAMHLVCCGFRPVPLFNGAPNPSQPSLAEIDLPSTAYGSCVDVWLVMRALARGAAELSGLALPPNAPPVFLLDSRRRTGERAPIAGIFDNRWLSFPTDFPSASLLQTRHLSRAVLVTPDAAPPASDLAHTLLRWQQGGVEIMQLNLTEQLPPAHIVVRRPGMFRWACYQAAVTMGFRRSFFGGFGGRVPEASSG